MKLKLSNTFQKVVKVFMSPRTVAGLGVVVALFQLHSALGEFLKSHESKEDL